MQGLRSLQVEQKAQEILRHVAKLSKDLVIFESDIQKIGLSLQAAHNHQQRAVKRFDILDQDIIKLESVKKPDTPTSA